MPNLPTCTELQQFLSVAPPSYRGSPQNSHEIAHAALQSLRDSGDESFLFLRTILELQQECQGQKNEELLFHCIIGLRQVILRRWSALSKELLEMIRDYLLQFANETTNPRTVKVACYATAASFWKRQWKEGFPCAVPLQSREQSLVEAMKSTRPVQLSGEEELFKYIELLLQPQSSALTEGCLFLSVLTGEFRGKSSVQYYLPLEFHKRAHSSFEREGWLDKSMSLCMGALSYVMSNNDLSSDFLTVVQLAIDVISWEFGTDAWESGIPVSTGKTLLRLPQTWRIFLIRPDFCGAVFHAHEKFFRKHLQLSHSLRQLLLLMASVSGPIFDQKDEQIAYATYLLDGTRALLSLSTASDIQEESILLDSLSIFSRLVANFKVAILVKLPNFPLLLSAAAKTGTALLQANVHECESVQGDIESMEHREWREDALSIILEGCVSLSEDPWLLYSGDDELRKVAQSALASTLCPLYNAFLSCRIKMARLEELHSMTELDEVREEISAVALTEEMTGVASLGRLSLTASLDNLLGLMRPVFEKLKNLWESTSVSEMNAETCALLEEARLLTLSLGHLLTDDNEGETPVIPDLITISCQSDTNLANNIATSVQLIMALAQLQAQKISWNPRDTMLSPLLGATFLWFLNRWAPAYILPVDIGSSDGNPSNILAIWREEGNANQALEFCATLCLHYQCYWPLENQVQEKVSKLLLQLVKRGGIMRSFLLDSTSFQQMATLHCLTAGMRHGSPLPELEHQIKTYASGFPVNMVKGYQRLPYRDRAQVLALLLMVSSLRDDSNPTASAIFNRSLESIHFPFKQLVDALEGKRINPSDVNAKEMASLCVAMYGGVSRSSELEDPMKIVHFMTNALPHLSDLMNFYAKDLTICESLLEMFRDYAERFVVMLDKPQSLALFRSAENLLQMYSSNHCASRVIVRPATSSTEAAVEEEQNYTDVLCAIQLLIHLGTKEFLDLCGTTHDGVESKDVTDVIFFGLQQIIPLMSQGLLQYPSLCMHYFSLVSFMIETYPDKVCVLPFELFDSLLESLLFGMSHLDTTIAKSSLQGISCIAKEQLQAQVLNTHLANHPNILDKCSHRLLHEVVFQSAVWDRLEASGMALLPLAAVDVNRFVAVVSGLAKQLPAEQQPRLLKTFEILIQPEVLGKITTGGYEGRMNRLKFKKNFELFVKEIHSFLVLL